ncbi:MULTISPECIES: dicarboxylate/amino acid:cation symporter [Cyanophyceae]|uniref:Dicarboxylate/amino acid:cation symporter n=1 Tax=Leptolyngbya subtilissima DQ-A4 TaxID=2933933 RepID=A0ABV0K765_9CYAN|nr:cation:dicarboxylase symporter family transporter [Nodosilinea sp. FACHB-141]MBD2112709.1 cation:dicarboxylase symporter family transporter [Nodosilinea sp. FACHB-141]
MVPLKAYLPRRVSVEWLRSPWAILISGGLGVLIGTTQPQVALWIAPFGTLYLGLLKMCVLPILLAAITNSLGRLMQSHDARQYVQRIVVVFPLSLLGVSAIAAAIAALAGPGRNLTTDTLQTLGVLVNQSGVDLEMALSGPLPEASGSDVNALVNSMVPDNIFAALSEGQTLKVLLFAMIFGVSLGLVKASTTAALFDTLDSLYQAFNKVIYGLTYLLPFGLCSLLAYQLSQVGIEVLLSMVDFVVVAIATFALIYLISTLVIWRRSGAGLWPTLLALKDPTILSLATSSSLVCLPAAITSLSDHLRFNSQTTNLVTPLAITLCRFGSVVYFASATLFVVQLYQRDLGLAGLGIVIVGSILAGMATSGVTGILTLTMLGLVLDPLKLPLEAVLVLFIAIDPLMDPFRTLGIVHTGMAATALVAERER